MKNLIITLVVAATIATGAAARTAGEDFDPAQHSTFTTDREDGRYVSSRAIAHRMMTARPPRLQYHDGMDSTEMAAWRTDVKTTMERLLQYPVPDSISPAKKVWSRVHRQVSGEALERENARRRQRNLSPMTRPYTT
ncbi:MAG: hypothetical protein HDR77_00490, partial [Bacteroides sp.]|nr:hypothetical protein [Bacteroides sp.]